MRNLIGKRMVLAAALALSWLVGSANAGEDLIDNPMYKFWAGQKPGATATHHEETKQTGAAKLGLPGGKEEKVITYTLLSVDDKKAVVQTKVVETEFLGLVEHAPTKLTYPAKIRKDYLEAALEEFGAKKSGEEMIKVGKEEIKCKVLQGTFKDGSGSVEYKFSYSDTVPGGIVHRRRVAREGDTVVAETVITLRSFGEGKAKDKGKEKKTDK